MINSNYCDVIIVGSGMAGLYSAYNIKKKSPYTTFLVLEKYKKQWIGGRTSNEMFYGTRVVTGAGIGRKDTNPLLIKLMNELDISYSDFISKMDYSQLMKPIDILKYIDLLKKEYKKNIPVNSKLTFKQFFIKIFGPEVLKQFCISAGYTDYLDADVHETLYNYGMDDNKGGWKGLHINWRELVEELYKKIGSQHFKFSNNVINIKKINDNPCLFELKTEKGSIFHCNRVIIATTISGIQKLITVNNSLYSQIHGQPFLRLYAKFSKESSKIMEKFVPNYTIVPGPLQKIIPMSRKNGVYMIAYSDNENAELLRTYLEDNINNRDLYCKLLEKSLGIPSNSLKIIALKSYYWPIGTHYYSPLKGNFTNRDDFVKMAQHPEKGMLVVGEAVSRYQGWVEGALGSVESVLTKKWIQNECK